MRLYVTTGEPYEGPELITWTASQTEASKAATAMKAQFKTDGVGVKNVGYRAIEVPTKKDELITFLNVLTAKGCNVAAVHAVQRLTSGGRA